jgi:hypothetical protein
MVDQITVIISSLEGFIDRIIRKLTLDIVANLVRPGTEGGTPVDTGWARANWVPSITQPYVTDDVVNPKEKFLATGKNTISAEVNAREQVQQGGIVTVAATYKVDKGPVFITNNVPYIIQLNMGSSSQAPAGFVQAAIVRAIHVDLPAGLR